MQYDLTNEVYGQHLRSSYIFAGTEDAFLRQLSALVEHVIFFPGNYIVQHGDSDQTMFLIHRGQVIESLYLNILYLALFFVNI